MKKIIKTENKNTSILLLVIFCSVVLLQFIGGLFPSFYTWGFSYWSLFSFGYQIAFLLISLTSLICLYYLKERVEPFTVFDSNNTLNKSAKATMFIIASVILGMLFYYFRSQAHIYGDGFTILQYVSTTENIEIKDQFYLQIGAVYLHHYLYILMSKISNLSAPEIFALTNVIGGVVGFWAVYSMASVLGNGKKEKYFYLFLSLTSGVVILFFGYIENYVWSTSLSLWVFYHVIIYIRKQTSLVPMFLLSLMSMFLHAITIPFFILVLFTVLDNHSSIKFVRKLKIIHLSILVMVFSLLILVIMQLKGFIIFVPLTATTTNQYSILYPKHITDFINLILLLSPIGICILFLNFLYKKNMNDDPVYRAISFVVVVTLISVFVINPEIGMVRDFDLFAFVGIPVSVLASYLLINKMRMKIRNWMIFGLLILFSVHVLPNLYEKNNLNRAVDHLDAVIWDDPHYQSEYKNAGRGLSWGYLLRKSVDRPDLAKKYFERNAESDKKNASPLFNLALLFIDTNQIDSARYYLKQGYLTTPHDPKYFAKLSELENSQKNYLLAIEYSKEALQIDSNYYPALTTMGIALSSQGKEEAYKYLSKAYMIKPISFEHPVNLGIYFLQFLNVDSAYFYFSEALVYAPEEHKEALYGSLISLANQKNLKSAALDYYKRLIDEYPRSSLIPQKKKELGL